MWSFCSCASVAKACSDVDDTVNKTSLWLHPDLKLNCRHMPHCTLSWSEFDFFFFFFPRQLCLSKLFSTYLSRKDVEIKRRENPAKHSSLVVCWGAIPRQKQPPYLRSTVSAEIDISITSYYKHSRLTTVPHLRGLRGNTQRGVCWECHLRFCFSPLVSPLLSWCWCHWEVSDWVMVSAEVAEVSLALIPVRQP